MKLQSIELRNYKGHAHLKVEFNAGFNVIVGVNGSGKTSILRAICDALTGFTNFLSLSGGQTLPFADPTVVRVQQQEFDGRYRFERQYPLQVSAEAIFPGAKHVAWQVIKASDVGPVFNQGENPGTLWLTNWGNTDASGSSGAPQIALPVLAFYRADRQWATTKTQELQAAITRNAKSDGYFQWWDASLDASGLQTWVIAKCLERFQTSSETGTPFDAIDSDELALVNQALSAAIEGVKGLKYDLKQKSLLVEWAASPNAERPPTAFENLSDGQRAAIGLVADIARRMCILNPQLGTAVTRMTSGVVLIDELDMHLHPRWQRILTRGLQLAFPNVQFIVASHSPQVLGELQPEQIIVLRANDTTHPQISYGLTSSQVLEEIMDAEARAPEVQQMLDETFEVLERGQLHVAREKLKELEAVASGIPELAGAQALLRRKEVLGR